MRSWFTFGWLLLVCWLAACEVTSSSVLDTDRDRTSDVDEGETEEELDLDDGMSDAPTSDACEKVDLLFVIDNSGSMEQEQDNLAHNAPLFAQLIDEHVTSAGNELDYRVAITTAGRDVTYAQATPIGNFTVSESGDNGAFRQGCGLSRPWLERDDADVPGTFACLAAVGTGGPGAEMPLLAMDWALTDRIADGTNGDFLRDDALLGIVLITDQDDCSRYDDGFVIQGQTCFDPDEPNIEPLAHYFETLDALKGARSNWATAVIAGPGPDTCQSQFGVATPATRMLDFAAEAGGSASFSSICEGDLTVALEDAISLFAQACEGFQPPS